MDYESLRRAWASGANSPDAAANAALIADARATLARRRLRLRRLLAFAGLSLCGVLALMAYEVIAGGFDFAAQWGLIPMALIPLAALVLIARRAAPAAVAGHTLLDSFRALRAENAGSRLRIVVIGAAMLVFAPVLLVMLNQMVASGLMAAHEMQSAALVLGGALALSATWMAIKYVVQLAPERRHLDALIAQYEAS